ncbi:hypothetical protein NSK_007914 [Nannochloropsis salina CCMP1776]|uniref:WKF domain-containing protein n=1 Tax=Nannochloropsis salina CCMP1776 TaxID=1027361 RepID=A0A4D9CRP9_9STRA|nr:hypothetical protein NSK_007914 [Nannochloropsis salina CCMP1776]|eukprot:TFJ80737.1 hypothetical protein NSK_007914 [Nannochloropsis salina CCMP1776]
MPSTNLDPVAATEKALSGGKRKRKKKRKLAAARAAKITPKRTKKSISSEEEKHLLEKGALAAKEYLQRWALRDRGGEWRFQTKRQVWILKHLYSQNVIDKTFFKKLVLPYISTLHGGAKDRVLTEAQGYLQREAEAVRSDLESEEDKEGRGEGGEKGSDRRDSQGMTEVGESTKRVRRKRAKKIVAALTDAEGAKDEESTK